MISKCNNIVINRTKFSDFENFDTSSQSTENLKLVGYVDTYDPCSGEHIKKNVAVNYPETTNTISFSNNYYISDLKNFSPINNWVTVSSIGNFTTCFRINSNFEGDFIQFNILNAYGNGMLDNIMNVNNGINELVISFAKTFPLGKKINVLFSGFPVKAINDKPCVIRQLDFNNWSEVPSLAPGVLFESDQNYKSPDGNTQITKNILITFVQKAKSGALATENGTTSDNNKIMVATDIKLID